MTMKDQLLKVQAMQNDFEKYRKEWSSEDCPLMAEEESAYKAGWTDALKTLAQSVDKPVDDEVKK